MAKFSNDMFKAITEKPTMTYICPYNSPLGRIMISSNGKEITGLWFDNQKQSGSTLPKGHEENALPIFDEAKKWLDTYFSGKAPDFIPPIKMDITPFCKSVLEIVQTIPFGQTMTYGEIANHIAKQRGLAKISAQAVGQAVGNNPILLIIPCHRVVGANGNLTGYAGGLEKKLQLLTLEKANISAFSVNNGIATNLFKLFM